MNKNKGFTLVEVVVSVAILMLVLIPSINLNIGQMRSFRSIEKREKEEIFLNSLINYLKRNGEKLEKIGKIKYKNVDEFLMDFKEWEGLKKKSKDFELEIDTEIVEVDFYSRKSKAKVVKIFYKSFAKEYRREFIKFEE